MMHPLLPLVIIKGDVLASKKQHGLQGEQLPTCSRAAINPVIQLLLHYCWAKFLFLVSFQCFSFLFLFFGGRGTCLIGTGFLLSKHIESPFEAEFLNFVPENIASSSCSSSFKCGEGLGDSGGWDEDWCFCFRKVGVFENSELSNFWSESAMPMMTESILALEW